MPRPGTTWFQRASLPGKSSPDSNWRGRRTSARCPLTWSTVTWPWRHGAFLCGKKKILRSTLERLAAAEVRIGQVYYDFKPANLIYQNNDCFFLVDPPDIWWRGVHLWDFACFRSSMRRHLWRISLRRPYDRHRRTIIRQSLVAFEQGYLTSFTNRHPEPSFILHWRCDFSSYNAMRY